MIRRVTACLCLLCILSGFGFVQTLAQSETLPLIRLNSFELAADEALSVTASDLEPGASYDFNLSAPDGEERTETLQADANGDLDAEFDLATPGVWQLEVTGQNLDFNINVEVQGGLEPATGIGGEQSSGLDTENGTGQAENDSSVDETAASPTGTQSGTEDTADETNDPADASDASQEQTSQQDTQDTTSPPANDETQDVSSDEDETPPVPAPGDTGAAEDVQTGAATGTAEAEEAQTDVAEDEDPVSGSDTLEGTEQDTAQGAEEGTGVTPADEEPALRDVRPTVTGREPLVALALAVGSLGWYGVTALLLAIVALHLTLAAKYWRAQSVNLERRRILGRPVSPLSRALVMRYYSLTEKLVFVLLFALMMALAGLVAWYNSGTENWLASVARVFQNPWFGLMATRPLNLHPVLWGILVVLFLLAALVTVVWLFIPRLRWVSNSPRSWLYHILSVLVPGSGLADEMWGLLLIVPWAFFGLDALAKTLGWGFGWGLSLRWDLIILTLIYLVNIVAVVVEFMSYRRRMRALKQDNPELAREFGLLRATQ